MSLRNCPTCYRQFPCPSCSADDAWRAGKGWLVFDIESVGLHGEGFAVGWVLLLPDGTESEGLHFCAPHLADGFGDDYEWVTKNVDWNRHMHMGTPPIQHDHPAKVRHAFWEVWMKHKDEVLLAADVCWPVEARFLNACIDHNTVERKWEGPYPLIDIASIRLAVGLSSLASEARMPHELPVHNPLADARQSARLLREALGDRFFVEKTRE